MTTWDPEWRPSHGTLLYNNEDRVQEAVQSVLRSEGGIEGVVLLVLDLRSIFGTAVAIEAIGIDVIRHLHQRPFRVPVAVLPIGEEQARLLLNEFMPNIAPIVCARPKETLPIIVVDRDDNPAVSLVSIAAVRSEMD